MWPTSTVKLHIAPHDRTLDTEIGTYSTVGHYGYRSKPRSTFPLLPPPPDSLYTEPLGNPNLPAERTLDECRRWRLLIFTQTAQRCATTTGDSPRVSACASCIRRRSRAVMRSQPWIAYRSLLSDDWITVRSSLWLARRRLAYPERLLGMKNGRRTARHAIQENEPPPKFPVRSSLR